jgi:dUTP pyrophosphatase
MDTIELAGLTFYGYHGAFDEERRLGQRFIVRLRLGLDLSAAGRSDDLTQTVNYAVVAEAVKQVVEGPPFRLIEALGETIAATVLGQFPLVARVGVRVEKPAAPVSAAPTAQVAVSLIRHRSPVAAATEVAESGAAHEPPTSVSGSVLAASGIRTLLAGDPPLVSPITDDTEQIQPNGIDLTVESVWRLQGAGALGVTNEARILPGRERVAVGADGMHGLSPGTYMVRYRETVALPLDLMAFGRPRSSLLRCGAALHTAVWDAGYQGRSESLLVVYASEGVRVAVGARLLQLVFVRLETSTHGYAGVYQGENLPERFTT